MVKYFIIRQNVRLYNNYNNKDSLKFILIKSILVIILLVIHFTGPESKVVSDKLHDGCGVFVLILVNMLNISDGVIKGLLGQVACFGGVVHNLIELKMCIKHGLNCYLVAKYGEVKC